MVEGRNTWDPGMVGVLLFVLVECMIHQIQISVENALQQEHAQLIQPITGALVCVIQDIPQQEQIGLWVVPAFLIKGRQDKKVTCKSGLFCLYFSLVCVRIAYYFQ